MRAPKYNAKARRDLKTTLRSSHDLFGAKQAERYSKLLEDAGLDLASGIRKGRSIEGLRPEHLSLKVGSHYLIYRLGPGGEVVIVRILHSRMDFQRHL